MKRIRIGVIGLKFGVQHVRTLLNMPEAHLVAVAGKAVEAPAGVAVYEDGITMMEQEQLDAVSLCVSPARREELIEYAVSRGIALFIEKPWATNLEHAHRLAELCRRQNALIMVGFSFRFLPAMVRLQELMRTTLGTGWLLTGDYVFDWLPEADDWLWSPTNGGGFFNENSCHLFDSVCALLGQPVSVMAEGAIFQHSPSEEVATIAVRFASGAIASLAVGCLGVGAYHDFPRIRLITKNGEAYLSGHNHIWDQLTWAVRGENETHEYVTFPEALGDTRYTYAYQHFFHCIRTQQQPAATITDGIRAVALAEALYVSARTGNKVTVQE